MSKLLRDTRWRAWLNKQAATPPADLLAYWADLHRDRPHGTLLREVVATATVGPEARRVLKVFSRRLWASQWWTYQTSIAPEHLSVLARGGWYVSAPTLDLKTWGADL